MKRRRRKRKRNHDGLQHSALYSYDCVHVVLHSLRILSVNHHRRWLPPYHFVIICVTSTLKSRVASSKRGRYLR